ncbi:MAG: hypothetical protein KA314_04055 [Chloroflexi bacterium]|nr:hypothetical protein [Chloroflexota bacterium]MBP8054985.1 hypothetical protein [Chloroflexota bacterium]
MRKNHFLLLWVPLFVLLLTPKQVVYAAAFTPGNLVIYRVGSGVGNLVNTGNPVFLDEYTTSGTLVQSIPLPTTASGSHYPLIAGGTATSEGLITLSRDQQKLLLTGYGSTIPCPVPCASATATIIPRVVAVVNSNGSINTTTGLTDFASTSNPRSAVSVNGTSLWVAGGTGGPRFTTLGATTSTQISSTLTNLRQLHIFSIQLYVSAASGSIRVGTVGTGLPTTTGNTITNLPGFPTAGGGPYGFVLFDLTIGVGGVDTLYVADETGLALTKYSLVGGNWTSNGTVGTSADAYRGLTALRSGTTVTLYATRRGGAGVSGGGELVRLVDSSGYNGTFSGTPTILANAATNTAFRGIALAPGIGPTAISLASLQTPTISTVIWPVLALTGLFLLFTAWVWHRGKAV